MTKYLKKIGIDGFSLAMFGAKASDSDQTHIFNPKGLLKNRHIQTLYATFFRKPLLTETTLERFTLSDGDFVECVWNKQPPSDNTPIVTIFHGLAGSINSPYIQGLMHQLDKNGFASVVMHFRGCYKEKNLRPRAYHSGDTQDAKEWIEYLQKNYPNSPLHTVGFSLGGNMMLKLLGEYGKHSPISSAVSISAPLQLDISADTIEKGFAKNYQEYLLKPLRATLIDKYKKFDMQKEIGIDENDVCKIKTIREFDENYTSVMHGFKNAKEYYQKCSAKQFLKYITTPTLIIHALDDPFMTPKILPDEKEISYAVELIVLENGGHVGFVDGTLFNPCYWLDKYISDYIYKYSNAKTKI